MSQESTFNKLGNTLAELNALLVRHNVKYSDIVAPILDKIKNGSPSGVDELIKFNAGMGSLNDVYICKENGHNIGKEEEKKVNEKYIALLTQVWKIAREV